MFQRHSLPLPWGRYFLSLFSLAIVWTLLCWEKQSTLLIIPGSQVLSSEHSCEMQKVIVCGACGHCWTSCTWRDSVWDKPHTLPFSLFHTTIYWEFMASLWVVSCPLGTSLQKSIVYLLFTRHLIFCLIYIEIFPLGILSLPLSACATWEDWVGMFIWLWVLSLIATRPLFLAETAFLLGGDIQGYWVVSWHITSSQKRVNMFNNSLPH